MPTFARSALFASLLASGAACATSSTIQDSVELTGGGQPGSSSSSGDGGGVTSASATTSSSDATTSSSDATTTTALTGAGGAGGQPGTGGAGGDGAGGDPSAASSSASSSAMATTGSGGAGGSCGGTLCSGACVDTDDDPVNCGGCAHACSSNHVTSPHCAGGSCDSACQPGYADCNGDRRLDGCEIDTTINPQHCGSCTTVCAYQCSASACCGGANQPCCAGSCMQAGTACEGATCQLQPAPNVATSSGPAPSIYGGYAKAFKVTLATDEPSATIYFTTDGSVPTTSSTAVTSPHFGINITGSTVLRYFAKGLGGSSALHQETFVVDASTQAKASFIVQNTKLDGTSPVVFATPGQVFSVAKADTQVWVQESCPMCGMQLVYGVDDVDQGCFYNGSPGVYPGLTTTGASFTITAPTAPGVHEVRVAHIEQTSCAAAMATGALATRPTIARIGVLVVR